MTPHSVDVIEQIKERGVPDYWISTEWFDLEFDEILCLKGVEFVPVWIRDDKQGKQDDRDDKEAV